MKTKTSRIFCYLISVILLSGLASAGFGSTYIPEINGKNILQVPIGVNSNYYIYPQNFENKILLVKIKILNGSEILTNTLQETYEVPINTTSDDFPINLIFKLENKSELIEKEFFVSYEILSTYKENGTEGLVSFSPIGYKKSFYIKGIEPVYIPEQPVNNIQDNTQNNQQSNQQNQAIIVKKSEQLTQIPNPDKLETPKQSETEKLNITEVSIIPTKTFWDIFKNINWKYGVFTFVGICILGIIVSAIKTYKNKDSMSNYNKDIK
jgi:hypothetical protein